MPSRLEVFWKKNRRIITHVVRILFLLQTIVYTVLAIIRLIQGDPIYGTMFFSGAVVSGAITFALVRFNSGALL